ncbi:Oxidoreductase [uncultured Candidatus Thioglobus sp.]|nr:Oxidoreductase [uncultured Candidatus Thioglobus sp.]
MNKLALGTVQFGIDYGINSIGGQVQQQEVENILNYAYSQGINLLDTAPAYGDSEKILGRIGVSDFKVVTKTRHFDSTEINNNDVELLSNDFYHSLQGLKQDRVYGVLIHNANDLLKPGSQKIFDQLQKLKLEGKITKIGVSVYDHNQLQSIVDDFDIDLVQLPFNILDRRMIESGMFVKLQSKGVEVHARSVFLQGLLLMSKENRPDKFKRWSNLWAVWHEWLNDNHLSALEATSRYVISMSEISKVLVGVDSTEQLKEIVLASSGVLPNIPDEMFTNDIDLLNPSNWGKL